MASRSNAEAAPPGSGVTILGAGIVGVCCALALQREGFRVTLVDRDQPGSGCSAGNAGMIQTGSVAPLAIPGLWRKLPGMMLDPLGPLAIRWRHLATLAPWLWRFTASMGEKPIEATAVALRALLSRAGEAYQPLLRDAKAFPLIGAKGELYVLRDDASYTAQREKLALLRRYGVPYEELDTAALRQMEPALAPAYRRGYYLPESFYTVDPHRLVSRLAEAFVEQGGVFVQEAVRELILDGEKIIALATDQGDRPVERVVVALGAFSGAFARRLGAPVPLESLRGYHLMVAPGALTLQGPLIEPTKAFAAVPMMDGIRLAGTVELASLEAAPDWRRAEMLLPLARAMLPGLTSEIRAKWMGHRPGTPDSVPVIGRANRYRNAWLAFGHGTLGLTLAAITGRLIAAAIAGSPPEVDLALYRAERFLRGGTVVS
jgi:D-amino-acid dehydrogenase